MRQSSWVRVSFVSVSVGLLGVLGGASGACVSDDALPSRSTASATDAGANAPASDSGASGVSTPTPTPTVDAGTCVAPIVDCDGDGVCETSLDTDPKNCGACGKNCGGGACDKGCKPATLLSGLAGAVDVAVNATAVVVLAGDGPLVCPKSGCIASGITPVQIETGNTLAAGPHALAINENDVFWLGNENASLKYELKKCGVAGCGLSASTLDEDQLGTELLVEGNAALRYDPTGLVTRVPLDGVGTKQYLNKATLPSSRRFAVANGKLAFSNTDGATGGSRGVWVGTFGDTTPSRVMNEGDHVAISGDVVYASRRADGTYDTIFSCAFAGCGGVGVNLGGTGPAIGTGRIADMTADASGLYWVEAIGTVGRVMHCALPDCTGGPKALATSQASPVAITTDDAFVYWVNAGTGAANGSVVRIAK